MEVDKFEVLQDIGLDERMILKGTKLYGYRADPTPGFEKFVPKKVILYSSDKKENYKKLGSIDVKYFDRLLKII